MMPWFLWNNVDSRAMGLWVSQLPAPTRAAERVQEVTIPGRAGTLTLKEGENVHEGYVKECVVTAKSEADYHAILDWLRGDGQVVFSSEPDRVYWAHLAGEVKFDRVSHALKQATIPFYVHPHKGQYPPESDITMNASGSVRNPGNVAAMPILTLTFTESCSVAVGENEMTFTANVPEGETAQEETITVDCDAELVTSNGQLWDGKTEGNFLRMSPGDNTVTLTDCTAVVKPRWRWC